MSRSGLSLGKVVRAFKARTARLIRTSTNPEFGWQRSYYDHIVRTAADLDRIRRYILLNPLKWALDEENPEHIRAGPASGSLLLQHPERV